MAHGFMSMDDHDNPIQFHSPNTTVITVAPPSRTSWSDLIVEYNVLMAMHKNLQDPAYADKSFSKIVRESSKESGIIDMLKRHKTHIPKSFSIQTDEIANKLMAFETNEGEEPDPYYGIWWLDDPENPQNLLAMPEYVHFPRANDREMIYFSDIVDTLRTIFPGKSINIMDYSCSSCLYPDSRFVANANDRQVRRLSRGLKYVSPESPKSPKSSRKRKMESRKKGGKKTRSRRGLKST